MRECRELGYEGFTAHLALIEQNANCGKQAVGLSVAGSDPQGMPGHAVFRSSP
jgi:hypothetical protein